MPLAQRGTTAAAAVARVLALLATAAALGAVARTVWVLPDRADAAITRESGVLQAMLANALLVADARLASVQDALRGEIQGARRDLRAEVARARRDALEAAGSAQSAIVETVDDRLAQALDVADRRLGEASEHLGEMTRPAGEALGRVNQQFLTCEGNPGCLQSRWLALSGESIRTMDSFRRIAKVAEEEAPATGQAVREGAQALSSMAQDGAKVTAKLTGPRRWYAKLWDALKVGGTLGALAVR
jgi:hypothetical protein